MLPVAVTHATQVATVPSGFCTVTSRAPAPRPGRMLTSSSDRASLGTVDVGFTAIPPPDTAKVAPG